MDKATVEQVDFLEKAPLLASQSVNLVCTDPPWNCHYGYNNPEFKDNLTSKDYLAWSERWIAECARLLAPNGSFWLCSGDEYVAELCLILKGCGLHMRNWVIWSYNFGQYTTTKFGRNKTHLLYFTKHPKNRTWNSDAILIPSARQSKYKDKRAQVNGRVPGDCWDYPRVAGTFKERADYPTQMNELVIQRIILACSNPKDTVLDCFCGSGTTPTVAKRLGRQFLAYDISEEAIRITNERLANVP